MFSQAHNMKMAARVTFLALAISAHGVHARRPEEDFYQSHLYPSYLQHRLPSLNSLTNSAKREVKLSKEGLFYHEGPYTSHNQAEREARPLEIESYVTPLPPKPSRRPTTTPSPYTYAVTGGSVTPALSFHAPSYQNQPTPSYHSTPAPLAYHGSPTPAPYHGPSSPAPYHPSTPAPSFGYSPTHVTYPHPPIPTHAPTPTRPPYTPSPYHHTTRIPLFYSSPSHPRRPSPTPFTLVEEPLPQVHHPARQAQRFSPTGAPSGFSAGTSPRPQPFLSPVHPTPFSFQPLPEDPVQQAQLALSPIPLPSPDTKPAITFQDSSGQDEDYEDELNNDQIPEDFSPVFEQESRRPKQFGALPASGQFAPQPIFGRQQQQQQVFGFAGGQPVQQTVGRPQQSNLGIPPQLQFQSTPQQQFQPQQSFSQNPSDFSPSQHVESQRFQDFQPQEQQFQPKQPQLQPQQQQRFQQQDQFQHQLEPQANLDPRKTETLFSSINKPATDREPRRQLADPSKMNHLTRNDALARLMDIAGSDWDLSSTIQENLVGGQGDTDYDCPAPEGRFPDVDKCHVYYQCANGIATRQSCGAGLKYNVLTNQCDWEASVDYSLNSDPRMLNQHVGPTPRPQLTALQQQQQRSPFQESNSFDQQQFDQQQFDQQQFDQQQQR